MEKVIEILESIHGGVDYATEKALIDGGILDSFDVVNVVGELADAFDVEITVDDMIPENFNSAEAIFALVERILDED